MFGKPIKLQLLIFAQNNPTNAFLLHSIQTEWTKRSFGIANVSTFCIQLWFYLLVSTVVELGRNIDLKHSNFFWKVKRTKGRSTSAIFLIAFPHFLFIISMNARPMTCNTQWVVIYCLDEFSFFVFYSKGAFETDVICYGRKLKFNNCTIYGELASV